ncbi:hypothetical protein [Sphingobium sp. CR28]|uniref:hypothetical protein n=1 Tax=Sphingobium sp. CR28 TaxID=3400272 RepID=UPI003FED7182
MTFPSVGTGRKLVIEREPFLSKFVARFDPPIVGDRPQRFSSHGEAMTYALSVQKTDGVMLVDLGS